MMLETALALKPGDIVAGRYELQGELGRGSYGVVYRALQLGVGRAVALKTLLPQTDPSSEEAQRFEREAQLCSRLHHPNIITLHDYGEHQGERFMVMEYVQGRSLAHCIRQEAPLATATVRVILHELLDALQYAHDRGVVHRDLKPENIFLAPNPSMQASWPETVKVLDFGIAKIMHGVYEGSPLDALTQNGYVLGTPQYMSPENITGDVVNHQTDLYALGLILYEMLTGQHPFEGETADNVMVRHLRDPAPALPIELEMSVWGEVVRRCLVKQPLERIGSAREIRALLDAHPEPGAVAATPVAANAQPFDDGEDFPPRARAWHRSPGVPLAGIAVALLAIAAMWWAWSPQDRPAQEVPGPQPPTLAPAPASQGSPAPTPSAATRAPEAEVPKAAAPPVDVQGPGKRGPAPSPSADPAPLAKALVTLESEPPGARVLLDGMAVGTTPVRVPVAQDGAVHEAVFSLLGYGEERVEVRGDGPSTVRVELAKARLELIP